MESVTPPADIAISIETVERLIAEQFPQYAKLPITEASSGWDNAMFRLGSDLAVRMPRRELGAKLLLNELKYLPRIESQITLPAPIPVHTGLPNAEYPYQWSIVPWLPGEPADLFPAAASQTQVLADFLKALHQPAPGDFPQNPFRGVPLAQRAAQFQETAPRLPGYFTQHHLAQFDQALEAKVNEVPLTIHGDLHPQNILTLNSEISAVIDWGDFCSGDPANDAGVFYQLFTDADAISNYSDDRDLIARARGWALLFCVLVLDRCPTKESRHAKSCIQALQTLVKAPLMP